MVWQGRRGDPSPYADYRSLNESVSFAVGVEIQSIPLEKFEIFLHLNALWTRVELEVGFRVTNPDVFVRQVALFPILFKRREGFDFLVILVHTTGQ